MPSSITGADILASSGETSKGEELSQRVGGLASCLVVVASHFETRCSTILQVSNWLCSSYSPPGNLQQAPLADHVFAPSRSLLSRL